MPLTIPDVARRLQLPQRTVERWVRQGRIPVVRGRLEPFFDARALEAWAAEHNLTLHPDDDTHGSHRPTDASLAEAIDRGGVHHDVPASDTPSILAEMVRRAPIPAPASEDLLELLLEREELSSTGIGHGVAVPHPRTPMHDLVDAPAITCGFLAAPVDFDALDGQPVHTMFLLLAPDTTTHLRLLSRLAFCLQETGFRTMLEARPSADDLTSAVRRLEANLETPGR